MCVVCCTIFTHITALLFILVMPRAVRVRFGWVIAFTTFDFIFSLSHARTHTHNTYPFTSWQMLPHTLPRMANYNFNENVSVSLSLSISCQCRVCDMRRTCHRMERVHLIVTQLSILSAETVCEATRSCVCAIWWHIPDRQWDGIFSLIPTTAEVRGSSSSHSLTKIVKSYCFNDLHFSRYKSLSLDILYHLYMSTRKSVAWPVLRLSPGHLSHFIEFFFVPLKPREFFNLAVYAGQLLINSIIV